jgi:hypothetical protein
MRPKAVIRAARCTCCCQLGGGSGLKPRDLKSGHLPASQRSRGCVWDLFAFVHLGAFAARLIIQMPARKRRTRSLPCETFLRPNEALEFIFKQQVTHRGYSLPWIVFHDLLHTSGEAMAALCKENMT